MRRTLPWLPLERKATLIPSFVLHCRPADELLPTWFELLPPDVEYPIHIKLTCSALAAQAKTQKRMTQVRELEEQSLEQTLRGSNQYEATSFPCVGT